MRSLPRLLVPVVAALALLLTGTPAISSPGSSYVGPHVGKGNLPAGCIVDRDPLNPDNLCYHMKVGLNALDTPKVDVDILVPVSPAAERDLRIAEQSVQMWAGGIDYLADEMRMPWLSKGFDMNIRTHELLVNPTGTLAAPLNLVDPEIVVVLSNPAGGIGIGIDPSNFISQLGITDGEGVPCASVPNPFSMAGWKARGMQVHGGEQGGTYVEDCGGVGGNVCFAVNGAVDPVPGASDFFPAFDLVSHEFGHCLTLGHVGDGADGPWGPTPTNDIMAYSTDPPGISKCVSTLDVEGFALTMSKYLDVNGDRKVDAKDHLTPNDPEGDGANSFQVQSPDDHLYASSTGDPADCPQPDLSLTPGAYGDFTPKPETTTRPSLTMGTPRVVDGRLRVAGWAAQTPLTADPTRTTASAKDATGDSVSPVGDITGVSVKTSRDFVDATISVSQLWPLAQGGSAAAYSLLVSGRRLDSFIANGQTGGDPKVMDNGTGYYLPEGTATWDFDNNTVTFRVRRDYLADQQVRAPYTIHAITGIHARSNDWVATTDSAPDTKGLRLAAPAMGPERRDAPKATRVSTRTVTLDNGSGNTFLPSDSTLGVGLVSAVDNRDYLVLPVKQQATAKVTLTWDDPASSLALKVDGGSSQQVKEGDGSITVTVPWARRNLAVTVDPQEVFGPVTYTLKATLTTVVADRDEDGVPDVADACRTKAGPSTAAGCPDTDGDGVQDRNDRCPTAASISATGCPTAADERVSLLVDGKRVATTTVVSRHSRDGFVLRAPSSLSRGKHTVTLTWTKAGRVVTSRTRRIG